MLVDCCVTVVLGGRELLAVGLFMIGLRLSLAEAFLYVMWDGVGRIRGNGTSEKDKVTYAFALGIWDGNLC
jgi:hypothetical protein